jgi:hypothetical protein
MPPETQKNPTCKNVKLRQQQMIRMSDFSLAHLTYIAPVFKRSQNPGPVKREQPVGAQKQKTRRKKKYALRESLLTHYKEAQDAKLLGRSSRGKQCDCLSPARVVMLDGVVAHKVPSDGASEREVGKLHRNELPALDLRSRPSHGAFA